MAVYLDGCVLVRTNDHQLFFMLYTLMPVDNPLQMFLQNAVDFYCSEEYFFASNKVLFCIKCILFFDESSLYSMRVFFPKRRCQGLVTPSENSLGTFFFSKTVSCVLLFFPDGVPIT